MPVDRPGVPPAALRHGDAKVLPASFRREFVAQPMLRDADDTIVGFQHRQDAERFLIDLKERLAKFALSLHPEKTRLLEFGRYAAERRAERGQGKPETFDFLVLTHYCTTRKDGTDFQLGRKTQRKRTKAKLREIIAHRPWRAGCGRRVDISGSSLADTKGASIGVPPSFRKRSRGSARGRIPLKTTSWSRVSPKPRLAPATTKTMTMRQRSYPNDPRRPPPGL